MNKTKNEIYEKLETIEYQKFLDSVNLQLIPYLKDQKATQAVISHHFWYVHESYGEKNAKYLVNYITEVLKVYGISCNNDVVFLAIGDIENWKNFYYMEIQKIEYEKTLIK